ncbi:Serine/threonine-protein phosphatase PGAM5, mitochondrial, putative [Trypanosoma equiperdum]|uniref:Serine/threonine-protein phosphatase PGAM5, mitochondrial n=1 Tax=Trypanosoma equiperdum TaxID=5694 RepID=A0A1G4IJQ9_TRYEQ|nr:Serine/threonine-protein phosphatase PGAM5, mitochondrial, putative [Trypanosoma equiperdum]
MTVLSRVLLGAAVGSVSAAFNIAWCDSSLQSGSVLSVNSLLPVDEIIRADGKNASLKSWGVPWVEDWDCLEAKDGAAGKSSGHKRQLILIRHGQYQNEKSSDDRQRTLTQLGEEQARLTGKYLWQAFQQKRLVKELGSEPALGVDNFMGGLLRFHEPKEIYVSDMTRAQQTVKLITEAFPYHIRARVKTDPILRERYPCDPQPPHKHRSAAHSDMLAVEEVFKKYFHRPLKDESSVEVIVGHANVIRYLVCRALQLPPEAWLRISLPHCSITSLVIGANGHVSLSSLGSAGHLPVDMVTTHNVP